MNILFLVASAPYFTNAVYDYDRAFGLYSRHRIHYFDAARHPLDFSLEPFDAIIFSYSFFSWTWDLSPRLLHVLREFHGPKVGIFQDEYDYYLRHRSNIRAMGLDTIVTCVPEKFWPNVFQEEFSSIPLIEAFTGYVAESLLFQPAPIPFGERPWHFGYRGRPVPYHYGNLTREKYTIGIEMQAICKQRGIPANIDVTEEGRVYGAAWLDLIRNCRVFLGTESGSNIFDFNGTAISALQAYLKKNPKVSYEEAHALFLKGIDDKVLMNQISPKIFETIALGTGLVLFEGGYSGVLEPWKHYIPLKKDYSNIDEVFKAVDDISLLERMTLQAMEDIVLSDRYSYKQFVKRIDELLEQLQPAPQALEPVYALFGWRKPGQTATCLLGICTARPTELPPSSHDVGALEFDAAACCKYLYRNLKFQIKRGCKRHAPFLRGPYRLTQMGMKKIYPLLYAFISRSKNILRKH